MRCRTIVASQVTPSDSFPEVMRVSVSCISIVRSDISNTRELPLIVWSRCMTLLSKFWLPFISPISIRILPNWSILLSINSLICAGSCGKITAMASINRLFFKRSSATSASNFLFWVISKKLTITFLTISSLSFIGCQLSVKYFRSPLTSTLTSLIKCASLPIQAK